MEKLIVAGRGYIVAGQGHWEEMGRKGGTVSRSNKQKIEYAIALIENEIKAADTLMELNISTRNFAGVFGVSEYKSGLERALSFVKPCTSKHAGGVGNG